MERTSPQVETIDPVAVVEEFRRINARLEDPDTPESHRDDLYAMARQLRDRWSEWAGEDSLHEMSFGEPVE